MRILMSACQFLLVLSQAAMAQEPKSAKATDNVVRTEDVIYGRKFGMALTMDVLAPKENANNRGIIFCVSGGWFSGKPGANFGFGKVYVERGYTVFAVVHGSQPKFTIPEVLEDMHRAVRFIRHRLPRRDDSERRRRPARLCAIVTSDRRLCRRLHVHSGACNHRRNGHPVTDT